MIITLDMGIHWLDLTYPQSFGPRVSLVVLGPPGIDAQKNPIRNPSFCLDDHTPYKVHVSFDAIPTQIYNII
jgi:hypothetical protein